MCTLAQINHIVDSVNVYGRFNYATGALASTMALLFSRNSSDKEALTMATWMETDMEDNASSSNNNNNNTFTTYDKIEFGLGLSHRFSAEEQAMMIVRLLNSEKGKIIRGQHYG